MLGRILIQEGKKAHYKKTRNSKLKEKHYINEKTRLAKEIEIVLQHSLKINKRGMGGEVRKKIEKLISVPSFIRHLTVTKPI